MGKQYTFKTTKDTLWLEEFLDNMDSSSRSLFIRSCIIEGLNKIGQTSHVTQKMSDVRPKMSHQPIITKPVRVPENVPLIEEVEPEEVDLDSKLNNLYG